MLLQQNLLIEHCKQNIAVLIRLLFHLQIKNLQGEVLSLKKEESDMPKTITADLEELRSKLVFSYNCTH